MDAVIILGATAQGKGDISFKLACEVGGEIIFADSRKVYKEMDIGTAKPPREYRDKIMYHLIDVIPPSERFSAKMFERMADKSVREISSRCKIPIVVGGSWLYIKAFERGLFDEPEDPEVRQELERELKERGKEHLWKRLKEVDPESAHRINLNDSYRVIRALEVFIKTKKPIYEFFNGFSYQKYRTLKIGLRREDFKERITRRVGKMIKDGLFEEVEMLVRKYGKEAPGLRAIGYREVLLYLEGIADKYTVVNNILRNTLRYAKYQMRVFSRENVLWVQNFDEIMRAVEKFLK